MIRKELKNYDIWCSTSVSTCTRIKKIKLFEHHVFITISYGPNLKHCVSLHQTHADRDPPLIADDDFETAFSYHKRISQTATEIFNTVEQKALERILMKQSLR